MSCKCVLSTMLDMNTAIVNLFPFWDNYSIQFDFCISNLKQNCSKQNIDLF